MKVIITDSETTMQNIGEWAIGPFSAWPFSPRNRIVTVGARAGELLGPGQFEPGAYVDFVAEEHTGGAEWMAGCELLVGHNLRFDMHYYRKTWGEDFMRHLRRARVWDTQLAEYILDGQVPIPHIDKHTGEKIGPLTLEALSQKYGGEGKVSEISAMIKAGICPSTIVKTHRKKLLQYQKVDVDETARVFVEQTKKAKRLGLTAYLWRQMDGLLATWEMEWNGMFYNMQRAKKDGELETAQAEEHFKAVEAWYAENLPYIPVPKPMSGHLLSRVLFGGTIPVKVDVPVLDPETGQKALYKSGLKKGQVKTKKQEVHKRLCGVVKPLTDWKTKKKGVYSVSDEVLQEVLAMDISAEHSELIRHTLEHRKHHKVANTYFAGYTKLALPVEGNPALGVLRSSLNHTVTPTGRLSSSSPNLQNLKNNDEDDDAELEGAQIKNCFVSRFGEGGVIMEVDFKQLEVVTAALLSGDPQLRSDILSGTDLHCVSGSFLSGDPYEVILDGYLNENGHYVKIRKTGKKMSFELQYGSGAESLAKKHKLAEAVARTFIDRYYTRYCGLKAWQECVSEMVRATATHCGDSLPNGVPLRRGYWTAPTGQRFAFVEEPGRRGEFSFSPPKMKNRPIQGTASAGIVLAVLGRLWRIMQARPEFGEACRLINMVHDSVLLDVRKNEVYRVAKAVQHILQGAPKLISAWYGIKCDLPLNVDIEVGKTWGTLKTLNMSEERV